MITYLKKQLDLIEFYFISLFFLITPAIYSTEILDPVLYSRLYWLSGFLFVMTLVLGFLIFKKKFKFRLAKYDIWVFGLALVFVVWNFLSLSVAINIKEGIVQALKQMALMVSFFYFYQSLRNNSKGRELIIKSVVLMITTFIGIGVVQLINADFSQFLKAEDHLGYYLSQALLEVSSTFSGKNLFPMFLVMSLPFTIYSFISYKPVWKFISLLAIVGAILFILILTARSAWLGLTVFCIGAYVFTLVYLFKSSEEFNKRKLFVKLLTLIIPGFLAITSGLFVMTSSNHLAKAVKDKVMLAVSSDYAKQTAVNSGGPSSADARKIVWNKSLNMAKDHPLLGVGSGQWRIVSPSYGLNEYDNDIRQGRKIFQRAHNDFLWIAGETGFVGLLLYLGIFIFILFIAINNFRKSEDKKVKLFSALAFCGLLAFGVTMLFSFPRERIAINMVYLMLFALILSDSPFKDKSKACDLPSKINFTIIVALLIILAFNLFVSRQVYVGEKAARLAKYAQTNKKWRLLLRSSFIVENTFYAVDPFCVPMKYYEGIAYTRLESTEKAHKAFLESYEVCPYNLVTLNNLATSYEKMGNRDRAMELYNEALEISSTFRDALMNAAIVNIQMKKPEEALQLIKEIEVVNDKHPKYDIAIITASKMQAAMMQKSLNKEKLLTWYNDENKIKSTFVRFKEGNEYFRQILMDELSEKE